MDWKSLKGESVKFKIMFVMCFFDEKSWLLCIFTQWATVLKYGSEWDPGFHSGFPKTFWDSPDIWRFSPNIWLNLTAALRRTFFKFHWTCPACQANFEKPIECLSERTTSLTYYAGVVTILENFLRISPFIYQPRNWKPDNVTRMCTLHLMFFPGLLCDMA